MKSPHLLSTVHDLAILHTITSVVTKRKDFITTQIFVSQYSADSFMIAFPTNHALMPHFDNTCLLVSRALAKSLSEFLHFVLTWPVFDSRTRETHLRHRQRSPQSYTSARSLLGRSTLHHNRTPANRFSCHHLQPYQHPASLPKRPQLCYSMLSCSAPCRNSLCFLLMSLK